MCEARSKFSLEPIFWLLCCACIQTLKSVYFCRLLDSIDTFHNFTFIVVEIISPMIWCMVKAPNIAHLSLLTFIVYNKKQTNLKNCAKPNKVIIILYLHGVQNENIFFSNL